MTPTNDPTNINSFVKLAGVEVQTATPSVEFISNVKYRVTQNPVSMKELPGFAQIKGHSNPIALVGGGPSIKNEIDKIRDFQFAGFPIVACGSSHDYLVSNGIIPTYCTVCDPDPITAEYLKKHNEDTIYLVALSCDKAVFDILKGRKVYVWNCRSDEAAKQLEKELVGHVDVLGGCTVGLRSISIVMCFGYTNIHFWGFDSCMGSGDAHHAYEFETDKEEIGVVYPIRFGDVTENKPEEGGKYYMCSGYQLAQAMHFQQFLQAHGAAFTPTFHGGGMLSDFYDYLRRRSQELINSKAKVVTSKSVFQQAAA